MSKCALDIKKDIIGTVGRMLRERGAYVDSDAGYFPNPNISTMRIMEINKLFNSLVVKEGEKGSFFIDPSDRLVDLYFSEYKQVIAPQSKRKLFLPKNQQTEASKKLNQILVNYLGNFGISVKDIDEMSSKLGIDNVGVADLISKIAFTNNTQDLPYIAGKFIAYMMQHNSLVSSMIKDLAKANNDLLETRNAIYYVSSGLGKTELVRKNPNKFADMDDLIEQSVREVYNESFGTSENSRLIYENDKLQSVLKKKIESVMQKKVILSPISFDKLKLIGFSYKKYYIPSDENVQNIIKGISERSTNKYDIDRETYEKIYVNPYKSLKNVSIVSNYISDEFSDFNDMEQLLQEFLKPEDYITNNNYKELKKDKYFDIIGGLIAKELQKRTNVKYSKSLIQRIKDIISEFLRKLTKSQVQNINRNIGLITDAVIKNDKNFITSSIYKPGAEGRPVTQVSIEKALSQDSFGKSIISELSKEGFILTGSTAISEQGLILRPDENLLHDIDWVSPYSRQETIERFLKVYPDAIKVRDIINEEYVTDSYLIAPKGHSIKNYKSTTTPNNKIFIDSYEVVNDKTGDVVGTYQLIVERGRSKEVVTGVEAKVIDFFSYKEFTSRNKYKPYEYFTEEGERILLANWRDIFSAKLDWSRYKDVWDYNRFIPYDESKFDENDFYNPNTTSSAYVKYAPKGRDSEVYRVQGNRIFNSEGNEVFEKDSPDRNKIFANLALKNKKAVVVRYNDTTYIVRNDDLIMSAASGKILNLPKRNKDRDAILTIASLARESFKESDLDVSKDISTAEIAEIYRQKKEYNSSNTQTFTEFNAIAQQLIENLQKLGSSKESILESLKCL